MGPETMISRCNSQAEWMERVKTKINNDGSQYASNQVVRCGQQADEANERKVVHESGSVLHSPNEKNAYPVTKYQNTEKTAVCHINRVVNAPQIAMPGVRVRARTLIH
jgi:hypothetical protein